MSFVLYITANPKIRSKAFSLQIGELFIDTYEEVHPMDRVHRIDLYRQFPQVIDDDVIAAREQLLQGDPFRDLNAKQQQKLFMLNQAADLFLQADKWVFVSPVWNWGLPPLLKQYLDAVLVPGRAYKAAGKQVEGLMKDKKAMIIMTTSEEEYFGDVDHDFSFRYLKAVLQGIGVTELETLLCEGCSGEPDENNERLLAWLEDAERMAISF